MHRRLSILQTEENKKREEIEKIDNTLDTIKQLENNLRGTLDKLQTEQNYKQEQLKNKEDELGQLNSREA